MKPILKFFTLLLLAQLLTLTLSAQITPHSNWTWMNGDNIANQNSIYGTQGVVNVTNKPGCRYSGTSWKDLNGNLWMLGGQGRTASQLGYLNDLWKYDTLFKQWTWMQGDSIINQNGIYSIQGIANGLNKPGSRENPSSWSDNNGNLWLFGGGGYAANGNYDWLNDLWKYSTVTNQWTWVKGDSIGSQIGV